MNSYPLALSAYRLAPSPSSGPPLRRPHHQRDRGREPLPRCGFLFELLTPGASQRVVLRAALLLGDAPLRADPPLMLEPLQRRIQGPLLHQQDVVGELPDARGDRPPVHRLEGQRLENEQIQRALDEVDWLHWL